MPRASAWVANRSKKHVTNDDDRAIKAESNGSVGEFCTAKHGTAAPFYCTRPDGHKGRHIAIGMDVVAAWPGNHAPTADDLAAVVSP